MVVTEVETGDTKFTARTVLNGARHLTKLVVVGVGPDGILYVASTHGLTESIKLCRLGADRLENGGVDAKVENA